MHRKQGHLTGARTWQDMLGLSDICKGNSRSGESTDSPGWNVRLDTVPCQSPVSQVLGGPASRCRGGCRGGLRVTSRGSSTLISPKGYSLACIRAYSTQHTPIEWLMIVQTNCMQELLQSRKKSIVRTYTMKAVTRERIWYKTGGPLCRVSAI